MKRKTQLFLESMNSFLNEKINKDNIEINKAIANPNLGKNKDKIKAAGYNLEQTDDGKVFGINNPKTGRWVDPSQYNKDEKGKVDFKGKLDTERPRTYTTARGKDDAIENRIPKSLKVGKDKYGYDLYNSDGTESYSPKYRDEKKKSISTNINDYNRAVKDRDENIEYANSLDKDIPYYEKKVSDAQKDLDWHKNYAKEKRNKSNTAEERRKAIIDKIRNRKTNESALTEAGLANLKTIDDFSDIDEFNDALDDDLSHIEMTLDELLPKMNLSVSVEYIKEFTNKLLNSIQNNASSYKK